VAATPPRTSREQQGRLRPPTSGRFVTTVWKGAKRGFIYPRLGFR
jgi:hypothetical protein